MKKTSFFNIFLVLFFVLLSKISSQDNSQNNSNYKTFNDFSALTSKLDSLISVNRSILKSTNYSIAVYSLNYNKMIYSLNPENPVKPASVTKLITSFITYSLVGDSFKIRTQFYTNDNNIEDKIINGNFYIKGYGDCTQKLEDLDEIVRQLKSLGIRKITGNIVADGNFFDEPSNRFHYSGDQDEVEPTAPITALSLENNRLKILVNTRVVGEPKVQVIPYSPSVNVIVNNLGIPVTKKNKLNKRKNIRTQTTRPKVFSKIDDKGFQNVTISGRLASRTSLYFEEFNQNPVLFYAGAVYNRLVNNGIEVNGQFIKLPNNQSVDYSQMLFLGEIAKPINLIINEANKNSNNYYAENLFKFNAAIAGINKNLATSFKILLDSIINSNFPNRINQIQIFDGSGLSRRNKISAALLIDILKLISTSKFFSSFLSSLAVAGRDGTLEKRMKGTPAELNVFAKTGTHRDVSSLAGIIQNNDGDVFLFAFLFNGGSVGAYKILENHLCEIIAAN